MILLLSCGWAYAQRFSIGFYTNSPDGIPDGWPAVVQSTGTNLTVLPGHHTNMSDTVYVSYRLALASRIAAWESNRLALAKQAVDADIAELVTAYSNLQFVVDNFSSITNLATLRTAVKAEGDVLLKLKPVLTRMYQTP